MAKKIEGTITYPPAHNAYLFARVCVNELPRRGEPICVLAKRYSRTKACQGACNVACNELLVPKFSILNAWSWFTGVMQRGHCLSMCIPACQQPGRVAKSQFEGPV